MNIALKNPYTITLDDDQTVPLLIEKALNLRTIHYREPAKLLLKSRQYRPVALFVDIHLGVSENGLSVISQLRKRWPSTAIIVVTSDHSEAVLVEALASGADDFIQKPIRPQELSGRLQIRLKAILQREEIARLRFGDVTFDVQQKILRGNGQERSLSPLAGEILRVLASAKGAVVSRLSLRKQVWSNISVSENALDRRVLEIRKALAETSRKVALKSSYGVGFSLAIAFPHHTVERV